MALRKHWPELLTSLRVDVFPLYTPAWQGVGEERQIARESLGNLRSDPERTELLAAFQEWANGFRITEDWIVQTALDTLQNYSDSSPPHLPRVPGDQGWYWVYRPRVHDPLFRPKLNLNVWYTAKYGSHEKWPAFKDRMQSQFDEQLAKYRRMMESKYAATKEVTLVRDAEWTARYRKGETAVEIANELLDNRKAYNDPEQTVYRAVERFAEIIGLTLRPNRKRRGTRKLALRKRTEPPG
jgi:hypothetical protein